jgi:hypothetical protein
VAVGGHWDESVGGTVVWVRRRLWQLWPDRNPLRRRCDRVEAAIVAGLMTAFVLGGSLAALAAGRWAYDNALRTEQAGQAARHQVAAVLLTTAQGWSPATAQARWTAPGGVPRTGWVPAPAGSPAGTTVRVWVDAAGRPAEPPLRHSQVEGQAVMAAVAAVVAVAVLLGDAGFFAHRVADRRRLAAWDAQWRAAGPRWSRPGNGAPARPANGPSRGTGRAGPPLAAAPPAG